MPSPSDYLAAALEIAEQAERDENGFLTEAGRRAVLAAYGMVDGGGGRGAGMDRSKAIRHDRVDEMIEQSRRLAERGMYPAEARAYARHGVAGAMRNEGLSQDDVDDTVDHHDRATSWAGVEKGKSVKALRLKYRRKEIHIRRDRERDSQVEDMTQDADAGDRDATLALEQVHKQRGYGRQYVVTLHGEERHTYPKRATVQHPPEGTRAAVSDLGNARAYARAYAQEHLEDTGERAKIVDHSRAPRTGKKEIHINPVPPYEGPELDMIQDAEAGDEDARRALEASSQERGREYQVRAHGTEHYRYGSPRQHHGSDWGAHHSQESAQEFAESNRAAYDKIKHPSATPAQIVDNTKPLRPKSLGRRKAVDPLADMREDIRHASGRDREDAIRAFAAHVREAGAAPEANEPQRPRHDQQANAAEGLRGTRDRAEVWRRGGESNERRHTDSLDPGWRGRSGAAPGNARAEGKAVDPRLMIHHRIGASPFAERLPLRRPQVHRPPFRAFHQRPFHQRPFHPHHPPGRSDYH